MSSIVPLEVTDLSTLARFIFMASFPQPSNKFYFLDWPNEEAQISMFLNAMTRTFGNPSTEMYKVVDDDSKEMIASLILTRNTPSPPGIADSSQTKPAAPKVPPGVNAEFRAVKFRMFAEAQRDMVAIDHLELSSIFVKAGDRKKGLGAQLVKLSIDKANLARVPLFLTSLPSAHGFYRKLGFVDTNYGEVDLAEWGPENGGFGVYRLQGMLGPSDSSPTGSELVNDVQANIK